MRDVSRLVDGSGAPGVYEVADDAAEVAAALAQAGWSTALLAPVASTHDFYTEVIVALRLPGYFGRNLDALWDGLTDLDTPTALVLADWRRFAAARPARWAAILEVLVERTERSPAFAVVLAETA